VCVRTHTLRARYKNSSAGASGVGFKSLLFLVSAPWLPAAALPGALRWKRSRSSEAKEKTEPAQTLSSAPARRSRLSASVAFRLRSDIVFAAFPPCCPSLPARTLARRRNRRPSAISARDFTAYAIASIRALAQSLASPAEAPSRAIFRGKPSRKEAIAVRPSSFLVDHRSECASHLSRQAASSVDTIKLIK